MSKTITIYTTFSIEEADGTLRYFADTVDVKLKDGVAIQNVLDMHNEKVGTIERKIIKLLS